MVCVPQRYSILLPTFFSGEHAGMKFLLLFFNLHVISVTILWQMAAVPPHFLWPHNKLHVEGENLKSPTENGEFRTLKTISA